MRLGRKFLTLIVLSSVAGLATFGYKAQERFAHRWLPGFMMSHVTGTHPSASLPAATDLIVLIVDHHEHPFEQEAARDSTEQWIADYRRTVAGITDHSGRPVQYTWFYPFDDYRTPEVLNALGQLVFEGLGEIEFHWHNGDVSNSEFEGQLRDGLAWFNQRGHMLGYAESSRRAFGYVAGNWELDNGSGRKMGPSRELDTLLAAGCYADFTFSNTSPAQRGIVSSIYYAWDDDRPASYRDGVPSRVGQHPDGALLIFQGPTALNWRSLSIDHGSVEKWWGSAWDVRIPLWYRNAPFVVGRPEWRFMKLYTHGVQSRGLILSPDFAALFVELKRFSEREGLRLHFATAREAYNIVRAAEDGREGNAAEHLDYEIPPPVSRYVRLSRPVDSISASAEHLAIVQTEERRLEIHARRGPLRELVGAVRHIAGRFVERGQVVLELDASEALRLATAGALSSVPAGFSAEAIPCADGSSAEHCYLVAPVSATGVSIPESLSQKIGRSSQH